METTSIIKALQIGKELTDKENWKKIQNNASGFIVIITTIIGTLKASGVILPFSDNTIIIISSIIAIIFCVCNIVLTVATSKSIGIKKEN